MMKWSEIPVQPFPVRFQIVLDGVTFIMQTYYRDAPEAGWMMDIEGAASGDVFARGIPLITGADLLEQYKYLFSGQLWVVSEGADDSVPTYDSLGVKHRLLYGIEEVAVTKKTIYDTTYEVVKGE